MFRWLAALFLFSSFSKPSFDYDLHISKFPGEGATMICFHGMGGDYQIAEAIHSYGFSKDTLIGFNFPDHDLGDDWDAEKTTFGTIQEILPALYVLKGTIIDEGIDHVKLYGFSAGGGAVINTLAALNTSRYDSELKSIGIGSKEKKKMLEVIQKGIVILDVPLKSMEELIAFRGSSPEFDLFAKRYRENQMNPIDAIQFLKGLSLHVVVCFQDADEILSNRDDELFIERLREANAKGTTTYVKGEGGHAFPHLALWNSLTQ
jgi:hypothetical protein